MLCNIQCFYVVDSDIALIREHLHFHCNNVYLNVPQCYVVCTLPVLLVLIIFNFCFTYKL
jgi:hypothetical protein